ncbi:hypothetical protein BW730_03285 [Tessaracoccus aquimaris]|uniref:Uncharacterized protein n=1 Tax=Tessaracoccus aquimaris TaxID=1332264 RepID=A0A1Q2CKV1_9ACTN|nr:hypothetical protein [Tessaracoccus aquimaris]AQP46695.1 hypothetical protein BW730_03285 [Tessaracoccus aquimaris]
MSSTDQHRRDLTDEETRAIVARGMSKGRRSLALRRGIGSLAAVAIVGGLGVGAVSVMNRPDAGLAPGDGPTKSPSPQATKPLPTPLPTPESAPGADGAEVFSVAEQILPERLTLKVTSLDEIDAALFTAGDAEGFVNVVASVWDAPMTDPCEAPACVATEVDGGVVYFFDGAYDGKRGITRMWTFDRAEGGSVYLSQDNVEFTGEKSWRETRDSLPLTDAEALAFVTDPAWQPLLDAVAQG